MKKILDRLSKEPSLDEILDDPIVRLMMRGDGTGESEVRYLIEKIRSRFALTTEACASDKVAGAKVAQTGVARAADRFRSASRSRAA